MRDLTRILAENREGWLNVVISVKNESAVVRLCIVRMRDEGPQDLRLEDLIDLGHAKRTSALAVVFYPSVEE